MLADLANLRGSKFKFSNENSIVKVLKTRMNNLVFYGHVAGRQNIYKAPEVLSGSNQGWSFTFASWKTFEY